jgi:class 3 adenylate cyclase
MVFTRPGEGAVTAAVPALRESRKIVTVLFVDVVDSTVLADTLDPEAYRALMSRYFDEATAVISRSGGFVEKFIGDAVMAVFGIPRLHEDDALRAVTAAVEIRARLAELNAEFQSKWGNAIQLRTGVETGDAVAATRGANELYVTGPTVNTAARLEQAAGPGEILVGDAAYRFVRDAVVAEAVGPLALKGKHDKVAAWKVLDVIPGAAGWARRMDARSPVISATRCRTALTWPAS